MEYYRHDALNNLSTRRFSIRFRCAEAAEEDGATSQEKINCYLLNCCPIRDLQ
jgi:hypothetical protein